MAEANEHATNTAPGNGQEQDATIASLKAQMLSSQLLAAANDELLSALGSSLTSGDKQGGTDEAIDPETKREMLWMKKCTEVQIAEAEAKLPLELLEQVHQGAKVFRDLKTEETQIMVESIRTLGSEVGALFEAASTAELQRRIPAIKSLTEGKKEYEAKGGEVLDLEGTTRRIIAESEGAVEASGIDAVDAETTDGMRKRREETSTGRATERANDS